MIEDNDFNIEWSSKSKLRGPNEGSVGAMLRELKNRLAPNAQALSILYVDDRGMRKINREHRGINKPTDVLSFPANPVKGEYQHLGDLVISLQTADKQATKLGVSRRREIETLLIHGFLHLCGYDHENDNGEMMALQAQLERELLEEEPLPMAARRGRKPGSKVKTLKDGSRVVVTGRAAKAIERKESLPKSKPTAKKSLAERPMSPDQEPSASRKRKASSPSSSTAMASKRTPRKRQSTRVRSGIIA